MGQSWGMKGAFCSDGGQFGKRRYNEKNVVLIAVAQNEKKEDETHGDIW